MEDALESGLKQFNDELERHQKGPRQSSNETCISIEEDLLAAENAALSVHQLMESEESFGNDVKSLASMFEHQISPNKSLKKRYSRASLKDDRLKINDDYATRNDSGSSDNVLSEASLSIKEGLAMFSRPTTYKPNDNLDQNLVNRRKTIEEQRNAEVKPCLPCEHPEPVSFNNIFTPIKSKESLSHSMAIGRVESCEIDLNKPVETSQQGSMRAPNMQNSVPAQFKQASYVDDATIKQQRDALIKGLKSHFCTNFISEKRKHDSTPRLNNDVIEAEVNASSHGIRDLSKNKNLDHCIENQLSASSHMILDISTSSSPLGLDDMDLSPINECCYENNSLDRNLSGDSELGSWVNPVVNDFQSKSTTHSRKWEFNSKFQLLHYALVCAKKIYSCLKPFAQSLVRIIWCIYDHSKSFTIRGLTCIVYSFVLVANTWQRARCYLVDVMQQLSMMSRLSPVASKVLLEWLASMEKGDAACLASFHISMVTEISTVCKYKMYMSPTSQI